MRFFEVSRLYLFAIKLAKIDKIAQEAILSRDVFRVQSNIWNEDFLRKQIIAFSC